MMLRALPLNRDIRARKEAETLRKHGLSVTMLVWDRDGVKGAHTIPGIDVVTFNKRTKGGDVRVAFYMPLWWLWLLRKLVRHHYDGIHAADFDTLVPAVIAGAMRRKPVIYDIYDHFPDVVTFPVAASLGKGLLKRLDAIFAKRASAVIIADDSRRAQIGAGYHPRVTTIVNSPPDHATIAPLPKDDNRFTIFFGGGVSEERGIHHVLEATRGLGGVTIVVMGSCPYAGYRSRLEEMSRSRPEVHLELESVSHRAILEATAQADLLFALYDPVIPNNRYASPNKLFEAMMFSKPILVSDGTSMASVVTIEQCGSVVRYGDVSGIRSAIERYMSDASLAKLHGDRGRAAYVEKYSWSRMETRLRDVYDGLLQHQGAV